MKSTHNKLDFSNLTSDTIKAVDNRLRITKTPSPWAVLLCKFSDNDSEPFERRYYEDLFTKSGKGSQNMVDFFSDVSHGQLDLSDSRVFGWYTLPKKRSEYAGLASRNDILNWARQAAAANGDDLSSFFSIVVCMNVATDLFGGGAGALCDKFSTDPRYLGQEMGHVYGLSHSRADTIKPCGEDSGEDYKDFWDIMSTAGCAHFSPHRRYQIIGPALNASNMDSRGWLMEGRVWKSGNESFDTVIQLRPLHRRDLPGYLAARIGKYIVEFRMKEGWDAGIPRPAVLIHHFHDNQSYIVSANNGDQDLVAGSVFGLPDVTNPGIIFTGATRVEVIEVNAEERYAKVRLLHSAAYKAPGLGGTVSIGVEAGAAGYIFIGGKSILVPSHSPFVQVLKGIAAYENSDSITSLQTREGVQREALSAIISQMQYKVSSLQLFKQPAPTLQQNEIVVSADAEVSKVCPPGFVYLVPGRISMNTSPVFSASPPAEEEIVVDAMIAAGVKMAVYNDLKVKMTLLEPNGCAFVPAEENLRPNDIVWEFPVAGDDQTVLAKVISETPQTLNRGNSKSFRFAIKGRAGRKIKMEIQITAQPVSVEVDSCVWTIKGLTTDTINLGFPLDDLEP